MDAVNEIGVRSVRIDLDIRHFDNIRHKTTK